MLDSSIARQRMSMMVFVVFAIVALTLASVGLYGVVAHGVTERTHEIGVRMALGAEQRHVLALVMRQGLSMALAGHGDRRRRIALALSRWIQGLLFGVTATDPVDARRPSSRRCWPWRSSRVTSRPGARRASIRPRRCGSSERRITAHEYGGRGPTILGETGCSLGPVVFREQGAVLPHENDVHLPQAVIARPSAQAGDVVKLKVPLAQERDEIREDRSVSARIVDARLRQHDLGPLEQARGPLQHRDLMALDVELQQGPIALCDAVGQQFVKRRRGHRRLIVEGFSRERDEVACAGPVPAANHAHALDPRLGDRGGVHDQIFAGAAKLLEHLRAFRLWLDRVIRHVRKHGVGDPEPLTDVRPAIDDDSRLIAPAPEQFESVPHPLESVRRPPVRDVSKSLEQPAQQLLWSGGHCRGVLHMDEGRFVISGLASARDCPIQLHDVPASIGRAGVRSAPWRPHVPHARSAKPSRHVASVKPSRYVAVILFAMGMAVQAQNPAQPLPDAPPARDPLTAAPDRAPGEGLGPYQTLVLRGAMLIDGTGGPPRGPVDIVISGNRIAAVRNAGTPGVPLRPNRPPRADHEIDATGMYVMPGFVDVHVHAGGAPKNPDAEYAYKLWLAHGVTTVRGVPLGRERAGREGKRAQREERDRRAAHLQLSAAGRRLGQGPVRRRRRRRASM